MSVKITTGVSTIQHICTAKGRQYVSFQTCPREGKFTSGPETYSDAPAESDLGFLDIWSGSSKIISNKLGFIVQLYSCSCSWLTAQ